nr:developmentally-regulated G-protein 2 [Tanacetum cinerariifolium]
MVLIPSEGHRQILTKELEAVGLRLNKKPPQIYFKKKKTGGISFNTTMHLTHLDEKLCYQILHEYKIHNAEVIAVSKSSDIVLMVLDASKVSPLRDLKLCLAVSVGEAMIWLGFDSV